MMTDEQNTQLTRCCTATQCRLGRHILLLYQLRFVRSCHILNGRVGTPSPSSPDSSSEASGSCHICCLTTYLPFGWHLESCPAASLAHRAAHVFHPNV